MCLENGRIQPQLGRARRVLFPAVQYYSILLIKTVSGRCRGDPHHSVLAQTTLVPNGDGPHDLHPSPTSSTTEPFDLTTGREPPIGVTIRRNLKTQGF